MIQSILMTDVVPTENVKAQENRTDVKSTEQIRLREGEFYFNAGQTWGLKEENEGFFDNNYSRIYIVEDEGGNEVSVVNFKRMLEGMDIYNLDRTTSLMDLMKTQLNNDVYTAYAAQTLVQVGAPAHLRFVRAKNVLQKNATSALMLLSKIDELGITSEKIEPLKEEIRKSADESLNADKNDFKLAFERIDLKEHVMEGNITDIDTLPVDFDIPQSQVETDPRIELGGMQYDYETLKKDMKKGIARLRVMRGGTTGVIVGFSVLYNAPTNKIDLMWVDPDLRKSGWGAMLIKDAIQNLPSGEISMDIWGGPPMENLAKKHGFIQNPGGNMANRYTYTKTS